HERRLGGRVDVERQGLDADLAIELVRDGGAGLVYRKRNHLEALAAELGLQPVERRHLLPARLAPRRPDIEQHDLAAKIRQRMLTPRFIDKAQLGYRLRRRRAFKGARALLPIGDVDAGRDSDKGNGSDREDDAQVHSVRSIALAQLYPLAPATPARNQARWALRAH